MRTRAQVSGSESAAAATGTRVPAPAAAASTGVACPECFQVGEHLDGCPAKDNEPEVGPPANGHAIPPPIEATFAERTAGAIESHAHGAFAKEDAVGRVIANHAEDVGQTVEVTWGEELFQPLQFNTFRVGPFKAHTVVRRGESVAQAMVRMHREIDAVARAIRDEKTDAYVAALKKIGGFVEQQRGGR